MTKTTCTALLLACIAFGGGDAVAQGHYEASPVPATTFKRPEKTKSATKEFEIPIRTDLKFSSRRCEATLQIAYAQRDEVAEVTSTLENTQCAASAGEYDLRILIRAADGTTSTRAFAASWQRDDDEPLIESRQYPVGENVEVVRVRTRGLTCTCAAPGPEEP